MALLKEWIISFNFVAGKSKCRVKLGAAIAPL